MDVIDNQNVYEPLRLTPEQQRVLEVLKDIEIEKYPVSKWYLGALYTLDNPHNPDRISQAAQSLRELLEKLPQVINGLDTQRKAPSQPESVFPRMRSNIEEHILRYKECHPGEWEGQKIDNNLAAALGITESYIALNKQPTRRERMQMSVAAIDPMANQFDSQIRESKRVRLFRLWRNLQDFSHHSRKQDYESFNKCLQDLERTVFDLLAPITAQDQKSIQTILNCSDRSEADIDRMFSIIERRGANYVFFFKQAAATADTSWLLHLDKRGYFAIPSDAEPIDEKGVNFPFWWPIHYLAKIAKHAPEEVIETVSKLNKVNNPTVYQEILAIALELGGAHSARLMPKIRESLKLNHQVRPYQFADLLAHWTKNNQLEPALELSKILVAFAPDPQSIAKQNRRKDNPPDIVLAWETSLEPSPQFGGWEYNRIMSKGVRPLAERQPDQVARILIDTTALMIYLRTHQDDMAKQVDFSDAWCERLRDPESDNVDSKKALVHTLTFACEQVYEKSLYAVDCLDATLRKQPWKIFTRLRQHLYARHPNEKTKPWIREMILGHDGYDRSEHGYESQQMIKSACEHFRESLLSNDERQQIFAAIRSGPSKAHYQAWLVDWLGEEFTEEKFQRRQRRFHRLQFKPFAPVLLGEYKTYFQELEDEAQMPISDEDYPPFKTKSKWVSNRSPRPPSDLSKLTDEELLTIINEWEGGEPIYEGNDLIEANIEGLAVAFQSVFKEQIIPDSKRLRFWMENRRRIERPIYVRMMINGMRTDVKEKHFDCLNEWLTFSEWVLTHPDQGLEEDYRLGRQGDESREIPNWYNSRRAIVDLIEVCLKEDVNVPISARGQLSKLLNMLCTQFDSWLDNDKQVFLNQNDPIAEGINNTRSLALEAMVHFGYWLRGHDSESDASEVTSILEKRFADESEHPLTLPEYAILGKNYNRLFNLNERWATERKSDFFPQGKLSEWQAAFESFVGYNRPLKPTFEILRHDFDFALQHLVDFKKRDFADRKLTEIVGEQLFHYYLLEMYPLRGGNSLLERYYQRTDRDRKQWAALFNNVGYSLRNTSDHLDESLKRRIIDFFDWRYDVQEPTELKQFTFWLQAKCLDAEWRLHEFSKILDVCKAEDASIAIQLEALCEMLPDHTAKVVECFAKLTDERGDDNIYIRTEEAKTILKAGLESADQDIHRNAERARENLLRVGRFDLLDLND